jgi:hypothetical protein
MIRIAGAKPKRSEIQDAPPSSIGSALISTPFWMRSPSRPGSAKAGSVVAKVVTGRGSTSDALSGSAG